MKTSWKLKTKNSWNRDAIQWYDDNVLLKIIIL